MRHSGPVTFMSIDAKRLRLLEGMEAATGKLLEAMVEARGDLLRGDVTGAFDTLNKAIQEEQCDASERDST